MEVVINSSQINESIKSGEYYKNSMSWYNTVFILPVFQKSILTIKLFIFTALFLTILFNLISILPMHKQLRYNVEIDDQTQMKANIIKVNDTNDSVSNSIAKIFINDYVLTREKYQYSKLLGQYEYMCNASSPVEYEAFKNYMSLDNTNSPILKYQKNLIRNIKISSINLLQNNQAEIFFSAQSINDNEETVENGNWRAILKYKMDNIDVSIVGRFNFAVTEYKEEMIKNLIK